MSSAKVELGRRLFHDERLSGNRTASCATCHEQQSAFTDGLALAKGSTGQLHPRNSMSLTNVAYNLSFNWADPDVETLAAQALIPMFGTDPVELGLAGLEDELLSRLESDARYVAQFASAYPGESSPIRVSNVVKALASFVRTMISGDSPYDRFVFREDYDALSLSAQRGMQLFFSRELSCSECHTGFNFSGPVQHVDAPLVDDIFLNNGLYDVDGVGGYPAHDTGLHAKTGRAGDMGRFRVPTLRNIALTAPYMHDGSVATLEKVLDHYAAGGRNVVGGPYEGDGRVNPFKSPLVNGFELNAQQKRDVIAFLHSLTDESFVSDRRFSQPARE